MERLTKTIAYASAQLDELTETDHRLVDTACQATERSYAPYSQFAVGAAVLLESGTIVAGSNQENVAFPSSICAERCAMFYANAQHPDDAPVAIAIAARGRGGAWTQQPITPCGACRQVLLESQTRYGRPLRILLYGANCTYILEGVESLLPFQFESME